MENGIGLDILCSALDLNSGQIEEALQAREGYVLRHKRKKSGGYRPYVVPPPALRLVQDRLRLMFDEHYERQIKRHRLCGIVQGCVKGKEPLTNALRHRYGKFFYHCDLHNAFGQVTEERVRRLLTELPFTSLVNETIVQLVTFRGAIPQGAPTSPVIFNWACLDMDIKLKFLVGKAAVITRYVDDISVSARKSAVLDQIVPDINCVIEGCGFFLAREKCGRERLADGAVCITGLAVNHALVRTHIEKGSPKTQLCERGTRTYRLYDEIRLPRKKIRRCRALLHQATKGQRSQSQVEGMLGWIRRVYRGNLPYILRKPYRKYRQAVVRGIVPLKNA